MAENHPPYNQPNTIQTLQTNHPHPHPQPPKHSLLTRLASNIQQASSSCLNILTRPSTVAPLLFTCICLALAYKTRSRANTALRRRRRDDAHAESIRPVLQRSMSIAVLHGGRLALQRIIAAQEARLSDAKLDQAEVEFQKLLKPVDGRMQFGKLQSVAGKLEMSGKEEVAVALLRKAMEKAKPHEAHELDMLLVEMLIYKGDYDEALRCPCLYDEGITDARSALYKAVIYSLKDDKKAEDYYKSFRETRNKLHWPDAPKEKTPLYDVVHDFNKFQTVVKNLKKEIERVKERKVSMHA
ncbi:uncharacterized protein LOC110022610 [Phalaenopsis equestris]|uniref:uncharacterized protein LOC110022610 n=1 Tax=Phalaenopsis equestris TaxID=78828 RepID=UPI0009E5BB41|nr:uncharacterized protein LOC110022610 [Phalaenopsis equestris]